MKYILTFFLFIVFWFCNVCFASEVLIKSEEARVWANDKGQELLHTLGMSNMVEKYAKLDKMMLEYVNLDYVSNFVIGKYARKMNKDQKKRYSELFQRYVLSLYKRFNLRFDESNIGFSIDNIVEHPRFTIVECSIDIKNTSEEIKIERIPVEFKLIRGKENRIQAVDIEISNVSMVIEYRKRFYQMIIDENEDMNWFLEKFHDKVIANEDTVKRITRL